MRKICSIFCLLSVLISSCAEYTSRAGFMAVQPIPMQSLADCRVDDTVWLEGKSSAWYFLTTYPISLLPLLHSRKYALHAAAYHDALEDALAQDDAHPVALANVQVECSLSMPYALLWGRQYITLRGNPVYNK